MENHETALNDKDILKYQKMIVFLDISSHIMGQIDLTDLSLTFL